MTRPRISTAVFALIIAASAATGARAQDLKYTSTTTIEMAGALGTIMSMFGGGNEPTLETTWISGTRVRKDQGESSNIMDWSEGAMTLLDHDAKTFTQVTLAQMAEQMSAALSQAQASQADASAQAAPPTAPTEKPEVEIEVRFSSDRPGRTERIAGYQAELVILTAEIVATPTASTQPEAESAAIAIVSEMWTSTDFPEYAMMQQVAAEAAEQFRQSASAGMAGMISGMAAYDPRMGEMWEKNMEALEEVDGIALRSRVHVVLVPPGITLDQQKVLDGADQSLGGGVRAAAGAGAADAVRQALGGLFGGGRRPAPEPEEPELSQSVIMRMSTEISGAETGAVPGETFRAPPDYTERKWVNPLGG
jgi:hypothetical protein